MSEGMGPVGGVTAAKQRTNETFRIKKSFDFTFT